MNLYPDTMMRLKNFRKATTCCSPKGRPSLSNDDLTDQTLLASGVKIDLRGVSTDSNEITVLTNKSGSRPSLPALLLSSRRPNAMCFTPSGKLTHFWVGIVSLWVVYNLWVIIYRYAFAEINVNTLRLWFPLDYLADFVYTLDMLVSMRTGFLEDGVLQYNGKRMRIHYLNSTQFYIDCLCLLPLDFLYLSIGFNSMLRIFRLCKVYKFWHFLDRAERHASCPNLMRSAKLTFYYLTIMHWNACIYKLMTDYMSWNPEFPKTNQDLFSESNNVSTFASNQTQSVTGTPSGVEYTYVSAFYLGMVSLFSIGLAQKPINTLDCMFKIGQRVVGLLLFATILGHVSNIITNVSASQKEFQGRLDRVKNYLSLRRVPDNLQARVFDWFDYLWYTNKITDEDNVLNSLPDKLKAEIAIQTHLDTLKRVEMFQNTEEGFLSELVLRLKMVLFAPGDFVCRKGEIGKQMFIVNRGTLHVLGDDNRTILATLRAGSYFGELSILNLGQYGNRRSASVRSLGYSDLFRLSKSDLWDVLKEYPNARRKLEEHAYKKIDTFKVPLLRSAKSNEEESNDEGPTSGSNENVTPLNKFPNRHQNIYIPCRSGFQPRQASGSDGYGSDPSHLSATIFTPNQSPTPPIMMCSKAHFQSKGTSVCLEHASSALNIFGPFGLNQCKHFSDGYFDTTQCAGCVTTESARRSAFACFHSASNKPIEQMMQLKSNSLSVPSNSERTTIQSLCSHCLHSVNHSQRIDCELPCQFGKEIAQTENNVGNGLEKNPASTTPVLSSVPTISFEKASDSSSSCSPCGCRHGLSGFNTELDDSLGVPRSNTNIHTSLSYSGLPSSCCLPVRQPICTTPSLFSHTNEAIGDVLNQNEYTALSEAFRGLQQRVHLLERENTMLKNSHMNQQEPDPLHYLIQRRSFVRDSPSPYEIRPNCLQVADRKPQKKTTVKRSTSLQVPSACTTAKCRYRPLRSVNLKVDGCVNSKGLEENLNSQSR